MKQYPPQLSLSCDLYTLFFKLYPIQGKFAVKIMDSASSSLSVESTVTTTKKSRRRCPLHTCGVSISAIACKAYTKARDANGPIGSMTKKITTIATPTFPLVHALQYQWLAVLSFADDHILVVEKIIETLFPPSTRLFDKIDEFVHTAEILPGKFDSAVIKFASIIHQVPFLDWALAFLISWLKFFISTLTHWGSNNAKEKEITVDINCNDLNKEPELAKTSCLEKPSIFASSQDESTKVSQCETAGRLPPISNSLENETKSIHATVNSDVMKCSYKEILEKGRKENTEEKEDSFEEDNPAAITSDIEAMESDQKDENESTGKEDPILELFEASLHMKPEKERKPGSLPRSVSYT